MKRISELRLIFRCIKANFIWLLNCIVLKIKLNKRLIFPLSCRFNKNCVFEGANRLCKNTRFYGDKMGYGSYIGPNSQICGNIGRFTSIAPSVGNNPGTHPYKEPFVSCSPMFYSQMMQNGYTFSDSSYFNENKGPIAIGSDCWIGEKAFLVGGIKINDGAIVLGGAFVAHDVPAYAIVGGVPAKVIGYRYDTETIDFLLKTQWWNNDLKWFENHWHLLNDMNKMKEYYGFESIGLTSK